LAAGRLQVAQAALWSKMSKAAQPAALNRARLNLGEGAWPGLAPCLIKVKAASASSLYLFVKNTASPPGGTQDDAANWSPRITALTLRKISNKIIVELFRLVISRLHIDYFADIKNYL